MPGFLVDLVDRPVVQRPDALASARRTQILFAFFWAAFTFFHQAKPNIWVRTPIEALQTAAAIAVIFRPSSLHAFLALVILQMLDIVHHMPNVSNHTVVALIVNLTILMVVTNEVIRRPDVPLDGGRIYQRFAPAVRVQVIMVYCFAVLHKLNYDFLNPVTSCASDHGHHLARMLTRVVGVNLLPNMEAVNWGLIAGTILAESGIPLLLLFTRTRIYGVTLGLLFHYLLGINLYHDFSGMIYTLLILFAPVNFVDLATEWWKASSIRAGLDQLRHISIPQALPLPFWGALAAIALVLVSGNNWPVLHPTFLFIWAFYAAGLILAFGLVVLRQGHRFEYEPGAFRFHPALLPVVCLVGLFGVTPYLGLKTENSFAMFSNLRTEGGITNHLFIPASTQVFGLQRDLVTVKSSTDLALRRIANRGTEVPFFAVRDRISKLRRLGRSVNITYVRNGVERTVQNAQTDPELSADYPWYLRKTQLFREVDPGLRQGCKH